MSLRPKTLRRLAIILTAVAVLVGIAVGLYWRNDHVRKARLAADRAAGIAAFQRGDYGKAIAKLRPYISKVQRDADALYAYGAATFRTDYTQEHLGDARSRLMAALQIDPNHVPAARELLDLYAVDGGYNTESIELADRLLKRDPNDQSALRAKCNALDRSHNFKDALALSEKLNELNPLDIDQQLRTYDLLRKLGSTPQELIDRANKQLQAHPNDPRFEMLLAMTYGFARENDKGRELLLRASTRPAPDATFVRQMVRLFDSLGMYDRAEQMLDRAARDNDPKLLRLLVQRQWQNHRPQRVVERLKDLEPKSPAADASLIAYKALSLFDMNKPDDARALAAVLSSRRDDPKALAWSVALDVRFASGPANARRSLTQLQGAASRAPDNAVIRYLLGEAYAQLGEYELAIGAWRRATDFSPSWATPHAQVALALAAGGHYPEAVAEAQEAVRCAPDHVAPAATYAAVRFAQLEQSPDAAGSKALFEFIQKIQKAQPGEAQSLPAYIALLNRNNQRDQAIATLHKVLEDPRKYDQSTLLRLAAISQKEDLELQNDLLAAAGREGETPRAVLARANELAAAGKPNEGLALLENHAKSATTQPVQWKLALCQYRQSIHHPDAEKEWIAIGDAYPNDLEVQTTILRPNNAAWGNRDFISKTIDRLKDLTGADGLAWKVARARWLILSENREKDSAEAVNLLNEVIRASSSPDAHLLLAQAYENVGNYAAAGKELQIASDLQPHSPETALRTAHMLQLQSRFADARVYIDRALAMKELSPELRDAAAALLAEQGDHDAAIKLLEGAPQPLPEMSQLRLAELYIHENRAKDARAIYEKLLASSSPSAEAITSAASFFASSGAMDRATSALDHLKSLKLAPGGLDFILAQFAERYQTPDVAQQHYDAATTADPKQPRFWAGAIAFRIRQHHFDDARHVSDQATSAVAEDPMIKALALVAAYFASTNDDAAVDLTPLAETFASNPQHPAVAQLIAAVDTARAQKLSPQDTLAAARKVVDQYPHFAALQLAQVQWLVHLNQLDEATRIAARTIEQFPSNPDAPRIAANVYRLAGNWENAAAAAQQWHDRTQPNSVEADIFLADAKLHLKDPASAIKVVEPHLAQASLSAQQKLQVISVAARAYAAANRPDDAKKILEPLLNDRPGRLAWLNIAAHDLQTPQLAEAWINQIAPQVPIDSSIEQYALANAWYTAGERLGAKPMFSNATAILNKLVSRPEASADAYSLLGLIAEQLDDPKSAEADYRNSLQLNANQAGTLNNLAYLILSRSGDLNEAKNLVTKALAISPSTPEFHDTLARILARSGNYPAAIESFQQALKLDPNNLHALIGLASAYTAIGKKASAANTLNQIDLLLKVHPAVPPSLRQELDSLRATVRASIQ